MNEEQHITKMKFKIDEPDKFMSTIRHFGPEHMQEFTSHYHCFADNKGKITFIREIDNKAWILTMPVEEEMLTFKYTALRIPDTEKEFKRLDKELEYQGEFTKKTKEYAIKGIKIKICEMPELGTYLELDVEGEDEEKLLDIMHNFGLTEKDIIKTPYSTLIRDKWAKIKK